MTVDNDKQTDRDAAGDDSVDKIVKVNGRHYSWPRLPVVVICCDGSEPDYIEQARKDQLVPNIEGIIERGENLSGLSVIPSFTNPNNLSIVTGQPPAVHGICGNYFYNPDTGKEVMMNDPAFLRASTIFENFHALGAKVAILTAKDKLRMMLGHGLNFGDGRAVCLSSECADKCTDAENGIEDIVTKIGMPVPDVYSLELSEFVFAAGVYLLHEMRPDLMYLSTTDYIQHKFAPGTAGANAFYVMMDRYIGQLDNSGAVVVLTADHGMKPKHMPDGSPDVIYLQDLLDEWLGAGQARVILPITDPYVVHHGALGSFATVYLSDAVNLKGEIHQVIDRLCSLEGIDLVLNRADAAHRFELPEDRIGDLVILSGDSKVLGTSRSSHDLEQLKEPLRSHGGLSEQEVPIIVNRKTSGLSGELRNFDAWSIGLNHIL